MSDSDHLMSSSNPGGRRGAENAGYANEQFLARLSHELRSPLSSILMWAEMLQEGVLGHDETREGLRVIERSAMAQAQLLDDLLEFTRTASGKLRLEKSKVQLATVVGMAVEALLPMALHRGLTLQTELRVEGDSIYADPDRLRQVVTNLLTNAIKFTPSGGRVTVELTKVDHSAEIRVADTGQGIDPAFLPHIFTPFSQADFSMTRSYGGLGLGLAISKELVELHGGTIEARSEGPSRGATFIVRLPLPLPGEIRAPESEGEATAEPEAYAIVGARILLVEDELSTQDALARMLGNYGAEVTAVEAADAAMEAFERLRPEIIISDVGLPREDGYQLMQRIRTMETERGLPATPAIALSAFAGSKHQRQARESGFNEHIAKPTKVAPLVEAIARLLAEARRGRGT